MVLQVFLQVQVSLCMLAWAVKTKPMALREINYTLWMNESVVLLGSYSVLLFTDYVPQER